MARKVREDIKIEYMGTPKNVQKSKEVGDFCLLLELVFLFFICSLFYCHLDFIFSFAFSFTASIDHTRLPNFLFDGNIFQCFPFIAGCWG